MTTETNLGSFDHPDRLNYDGTVTFTITPSNWHAYGISPDTYQTVNGDSWLEMELYNLNEVLRDPGFHGGGISDYFKGLDYLDGTDFEFEWGDFNWDYDHRAILRDFAQVLVDWIAATLEQAGLELEDYRLVGSWSPQFYNFTSDGFEMEVTCDPAKLRELTPGFDVDDWAYENYRSYDGFLSFVTSRMHDENWHSIYDGEFRVESLLRSLDPHGERSWVMDLVEVEWEIYAEHVTVEPDLDRIRERFLAEGGAYLDSQYTEAELDEWAHECELDFRTGDYELEPPSGESL